MTRRCKKHLNHASVSFGLVCSYLSSFLAWSFKSLALETFAGRLVLVVCESST